MTTAVGIFGGTFSPIHHGHLRLAIELRERLALDRVHVIPAGEPPHRDRPGVSARRRLQWVQLACAGEPGLVVDDREVRRGGRSYTYDTLASLRAELPDASLVLLLGDDAANQFHTWHRWQEIPQLAHLVFVERPLEPAARAPEVQALLADRRVADANALKSRPAGAWMTATLPPLAISSTRVRRLLKAGRSVRGLVPQAVIDSFTTEDIDFLTHDEDPAQRDA
jgi:nicotinate-nucleotide adenylyltransferase